MEKRQNGLLPVLCVVFSLGLCSAASCVAAELKRAKVKDLKLNGKQCYLPETHSFRLGIAALICLCVAQIIGNLVVVLLCFLFHAKTPMVSTFLLIISWISFGISVILLGSATSMSGRQPYGKGWLEGECYLVKDGVFTGSAILVLLTMASTLASAITTITTTTISQVNQQHQLDPKF
ncbi:hypothetical protein CsatB_000862 [Cannabis sativa]|uniref:Uncharacterized protein n=1 Tax=Cannabis sativa TaxID=3483 RepID=A0A7J6HTU5_CANSA|nr:hypothetical protein F8388_003147 [Cannabis sativa]KAF4374210.1 hypothetical protein F8388_022976 [Cannabis sativa]KAF4398666.1 hypothetical protein G4B88_017092 [Cannabis sativa]